MLMLAARFAAIILFCLPAGAVLAQVDTTRAQRLDAVVVTADRNPSSITNTVASVSRIDARSMRLASMRSVADLLRLVPGVALVDFDGLGYDPQLMMRGFYGGGEAEYVLLLVDGKPLNVLESGRATWDQIPLAAIESVEIVRGGASAVWGDAALAGVINLRTRTQGAPRLQVTTEGGSFGEVRASMAAAGPWMDIPVSLFGSYSALGGFRDHAGRLNFGFGGSIGLIDTPRGHLNVTTMHDWRSVDEPGALITGDLESSRTQSLPYFRYDNGDESTHRVGLDFRSGAGTSVVSGQLTAELRHHDRVRTLVLTPDFADTKNRDLNTSRITGNAQLTVPGPFSAANDFLMVGVDASFGGLRSRYYNFMQGSRDDYMTASAERGTLDAEGDGARATVAGFFTYGVDVGNALRLTAGSRLDWVEDTFEALAPGQPETRTATHVAFSPKVGINFRYGGSSAAGNAGNLYANIGRSFKTPTQDQLFDQRSIPVPFPPFAITFANNALQPQYGINYEVGLYHGADLAANGTSADITFSAYQMDLRDELDFDIQTFRYQNIGRSRHRGLEAGVTVHAASSLSVFANYTLQAATSRTGDNAGKYLKAIPKHLVTAGGGIGGGQGLELSTVVTSASGMFLDDGNTQTLESWSRWDVRAGYGFSGVRVYVDVMNVFDARYNSTGFPDPSGGAGAWYYPAAGRSLRLGAGVSR